MTSKELRFYRETTLKISRAELARLILTPYRTVQDWEDGKRPIPGVMKALMYLLIGEKNNIKLLR